jgi:hypothetical protein
MRIMKTILTSSMNRSFFKMSGKDCLNRSRSLLNKTICNSTPAIIDCTISKRHQALLIGSGASNGASRTIVCPIDPIADWNVFVQNVLSNAWPRFWSTCRKVRGGVHS